MTLFGELSWRNFYFAGAGFFNADDLVASGWVVGWTFMSTVSLYKSKTNGKELRLAESGDEIFLPISHNSGPGPADMNVHPTGLL